MRAAVAFGMPTRTKNSIVEPSVFVRDFFRVANSKNPPHGEARLATTWFEKRMQELAETHRLWCQNKGTGGEWMKVDHVFVREKTYAHFPVVAVEHENGDLCADTKAGSVPPGDARGAYIEWALWKTLTMRAKLAVLVAYPWEHDKDVAKQVLARMVEGYREEFIEMPNALMLLGWWGARNGHPWRAEDLYEPLVPVLDDGVVKLREIEPAPPW